MVTIARAASCNVSSRIVAKRCGKTVWSMAPTVTPSPSTQMLRVCFPITFMAALLSRFAVQRTWRCTRDTCEFFRETASGTPQFRRGPDAKHAEHRGPGRRCEGISMLRHFAPVAFLAFTLMLSILPAKPAWSSPVIEVVFVLDTTGSMGPLIEGAKRKIWSIATTLIDCSPDADIRMGLVAYRDIGDDYVTKTFNLTTDIQGLYADLLQLQARGGGDWPESVNEALYVGVTKMNWSRGRDSTRIIFLVGDAPPHMDYAQDMK